jgi:hypothetical protein
MHARVKHGEPMGGKVYRTSTRSVVFLWFQQFGLATCFCLAIFATIRRHRFSSSSCLSLGLVLPLLSLFPICLVAIQQPERDITALDVIPTNQTLKRNTLAKRQR